MLTYPPTDLSAFTSSAILYSFNIWFDAINIVIMHDDVMEVE